MSDAYIRGGLVHMLPRAGPGTRRQGRSTPYSMQGTVAKVCAILLVILPVVVPESWSIPFPKLLKECYDDISEKFSTHEYPGELPSTICINKYSWWTDSATRHPPIPPANLQYVHNLAQKGYNKRTKREAVGPKRKRKEIRMLSRKELKNFFKALKSIKTKKVPDTNGTQSIYDAIASIHNGDIAKTAHYGPNFLSWHRVYLSIFEEALHEVQPGVILPYWDCTIEEGLETPRLSKFFSNAFMGKAKGKLKRSKFGDRKLWNIVRNIETGGPLPCRDDIDMVLTRNHTKDILPPFSKLPYNLEYLHNGIHSYIGGHLSALEKAPLDPLFFLLHCYIDYVFEKFRQRQKSLGIDPAADYPNPGEDYLDGRHAPNRSMEVFENYTNADGFSNYWTDELYEYEDSPSTCVTSCGSDHLICIKGLCYPKVSNGRPIPKLPDEYERKNSSTTSRKRRDVPVKSKFKSGVCSGNHCPGSDSPIQNIFSINGGQSNMDEWVFMAVHVTFFRPPNLHFDTFQMHNDSIDTDKDIFDPAYSNVLKSSMDVGHQGTYGYCRVNSGGVGRVYVRSDGINYKGYSMEYALVDERYPVSTGTVYVPIKDPANSPSEVSLIAYDECGRVCMPTCLVKGSYPPKYKPCTGCIRVDDGLPHRYGKTVANLIYQMWHFRKGPSDGTDECPTPSHADIFVNFLCDSSDLYPWERL